METKRWVLEREGERKKGSKGERESEGVHMRKWERDHLLLAAAASDANTALSPAAAAAAPPEYQDFDGGCMCVYRCCEGCKKENLAMHALCAIFPEIPRAPYADGFHQVSHTQDKREERTQTR
jgi:hypothetical protein